MAAWLSIRKKEQRFIQVAFYIFILAIAPFLISIIWMMVQQTEAFQFEYIHDIFKTLSTKIAMGWDLQK